MSASIGKDLASSGTGDGGSSTTVPIWIPDAPPIVAHASDDEFADQAAFDAKWAKAASPGASYVSRAVANGRLTLSGTGSGADNSVRWYQAIPASEFVIYTKVSLECPNTNYTNGIIFVSDNLATSPSTADALQLEVYWGSASQGYIYRLWSAYNTISTPSTLVGTVRGGSAYFRMRVNGTSVAGDFSTDGIGWVNISTVVAGFTPVHMGIAFDKFDATLGYGHFEFFRCQVGSGISGMNASRLGREAQLLVA